VQKVKQNGNEIKLFFSTQMQHATYVYAAIDGEEYPSVVWNASLRTVVTPDFCVCTYCSRRSRTYTADPEAFHLSIGMPIRLASTDAMGTVETLEPLTVRLKDEPLREVSLCEIEYRRDYLTLTNEGVEVRCTIDTLPIVANIDGIKMIESRGRLWLVPLSSPEPPVRYYLPGNLWSKRRSHSARMTT
jgi:hypothetical protein